MVTTATVHKDRKKDCPAWKATCSCGVPHHYQKLCIKKGIPPPPKDKETKKEEELNSVVTHQAFQLEHGNRKSSRKSGRSVQKDEKESLIKREELLSISTAISFKNKTIRNVFKQSTWKKNYQNSSFYETACRNWVAFQAPDNAHQAKVKPVLQQTKMSWWSEGPGFIVWIVKYITFYLLFYLICTIHSISCGLKTMIVSCRLFADFFYPWFTIILPEHFYLNYTMG